MICYDIVDDRLREKVRKLLSEYGERVQFSVFECMLSETAVMEIGERLLQIVNTETDSIRFYPLCSACVKRLIVDGNWSCEPDEGFIIV